MWCDALVIEESDGRGQRTPSCPLIDILLYKRRSQSERVTFGRVSLVESPDFDDAVCALSCSSASDSALMHRCRWVQHLHIYSMLLLLLLRRCLMHHTCVQIQSHSHLCKSTGFAVSCRWHQLIKHQYGHLALIRFNLMNDLRSISDVLMCII